MYCGYHIWSWPVHLWPIFHNFFFFFPLSNAKHSLWNCYTLKILMNQLSFPKVSMFYFFHIHGLFFHVTKWQCKIILIPQSNCPINAKQKRSVNDIISLISSTFLHHSFTCMKTKFSVVCKLWGLKLYIPLWTPFSGELPTTVKVGCCWM